MAKATKWLIGIIVILLVFILSLIFIPKTTFNSILYGIGNKIIGIQENKITKKEGETKAIEKNVQNLEKKNKDMAKKTESLKKQKQDIKPSKNLQELKELSNKLGYPTR